jgi:hypothetical protein
MALAVLAPLPILATGYVSDQLPSAVIGLPLLWSPWVLAPLYSYWQALVDTDRPLPDDEPCVRSGTLLGLHWFAFASRPATVSWTRDGVVAAKIRSRPVPLELRDLSGHVSTASDQRRWDHVDAALHAAGETLVGMGFAYLLITVWFTVLGGASGLIVALVMGFVFGLLPACIGFSLTYAVGFVLTWFVWNRLLAPRRSTGITLTPTLLRTDEGAIELDHPDLQVTLTHHGHGTRLTVANAAQQLVLHGDHALLQPLAAHLRQHRDATSDTEREQVKRTLAGLARSAQPSGT